MKKTLADLAKTAQNAIPELPSLEATTKIAITGLSHSGKTVFITSLIDQLLNQKKVSWLTSKHRPFKVRLAPPKATMKRFDYYTFAREIKQKSAWPNGTDTITSTVLEFEKKSKFSFLKNSRFKLEIIDYPGEWILDIGLLNLSYEAWSTRVLTWLQESEEPEALRYLDELKTLCDQSGGPVLEHKLHDSYCTLLHHLKERHYSLLTPGRFLMPADLAGDPLLVFAPIANTKCALHAVYKKRYDAYLHDIVRDIQLKHFHGFDRQIVLVDMVEALQHGPKCYHDMKTGLDRMLSLYSYKNRKFFFKFFPSIRNVTFVATKADLVAASQSNNYLALLDEMTENIRAELDISHIKTNTQVIASVKCTQSITQQYQGKTLSFVRGVSAKDKKLVEIYPGEMPSSYPPPTQWRADHYAYEAFLPPQKSYKENEPFDHIHMDRVIESLIGDLL
ncbi:YcjX family protein [Sulfurospirillum sp. 1612]|uniref:YcjX family protein n=1 Tax=Sulfurospirillum sp. 1612 TaxID=3094835 RepID=UPI002F953CF4